MEAAFWVGEEPSKVRAIRNTRERTAAERRERFKTSILTRVEHNSGWRSGSSAAPGWAIAVRRGALHRCCRCSRCRTCG